MENGVEYYLLTQPQKGIWYTEKMYPGTSIGNIAATLKIHGKINYDILENAINLFVKNNEAVRLQITEKDNEPYQYFVDFKYSKFEFYDFTEKNPEEFFSWDKKQTEKPFELLNSKLFYFALVKIDEETGGFYVKMHHLISDAWSMGIVGNSIIEYYSKLKNYMEIDFCPRPSYKEFILKADGYQTSDRFKSDEEYWKARLADFTEITSLKPRKEMDIKAKRKTFVLPKKLTDKLKRHCSENSVSEYSVFFAALLMYINRVASKDDITIGTPLLNRTNAREKEMFGMFASTAVPVRTKIREDMNFEELTGIISKEVLSVLRHQKYPYNLMQKFVHSSSGVNDALFDIVLSYQNSKFRNDFNERFFTRWHFSGYQIESLIININDRDNDDKFIIDYDFLVSLFSATEIDFIHQHIVSILWHALDNPKKRISRLEMISEIEKQRILIEFNNTKAEYPGDMTIPELFEEQTAKTPDRIAAVSGNNALTYDELNKRSNRLARLLREKGVTRDSVVSLIIERSLDMIVGILGILKAGGAYLPIDPKYPVERKQYILKNSGAKIVLANTAFLQDVDFKGSIIDPGSNIIGDYDNSNLACINEPDDLVYIIYTSGSTGNPKGVMIEHRGLVNRLNWMQKEYPLNKDSRILQKTTYTFDVSVWELIWGLLTGARLCFLRPNGEKDPEEIIKAISDYGITTMHFVPSMLNAFLKYVEETNSTDRLSTLRQVFASGEALSLGQVDKFNELLNRRIGCSLYNLYGPTEASIDVTYFNCSPDLKYLRSVPIGKPIDNTKLLILDKHMNLVPIGIAGELFIGGVGVARGYINNTELTRERFIENPYFPGEMIYRTGDLARWYPKGDIEYLGRIDNQVKIRGFRVELTEIEKALLNNKDISNVIVIGKPKPNGENFLCAYYISNNPVSSEYLRAYLLERLPDYMVPSYFVRISEMPLLPNGKINRKALPDIDTSKTDAEHKLPANETESILFEIVAETLKTREFGTNNNFFDLGGDSLMIIDILIKLYKYGWGLSAADFYKYPTIKSLSAKILGYSADENSLNEAEGFIDIKRFKETYRNRKIKVPQNILLTGVTGFLGIHLLKEFIDHTDANVYCMIRGRDASEARDKLKNALSSYFDDNCWELFNDRIFIVVGDVGLDKFSLSDKAYSELSSVIDTIVHSAAIVKYFGAYSEFVNVNINGTRRIIDFAKEFNKKLYYLSTLAVSGSYLVSHEDNVKVFGEDSFYIGQNYKENVYVRSKFEAENEIYKQIDKGLDATVLRMGNLTGRFSDGRFQNNIDDNAFYRIIKSIYQLSLMPENQLQTNIEFTPVDLAGRALRMIIMESKRDRLIYHILNHNEITASHLIDLFDSIGIRINIVKSEDFRSYIEKISIDQKMNKALSGIITDIGKDKDLDYNTPIVTNSDETQKCLKKLGFEWPVISSGYIEKIIEHMRLTGFIEKLG